MRILIAPDKFKGALSAREVADNIAAGLHEVLPEAEIDIMPMADGGEGTAEVICNALGGSWSKCKAHDPLGREIEARYAFIANRKLAVMEMSEVAGMRRLSRDEYDVDLASTFGVGEMILDAARNSAGQIIIGLGGSATNDGGFGMARAIGFRFFGRKQHRKLDRFKRSSLRENETELQGAVTELLNLAWLKEAKQLSLPKIVAAADVRNPLLGENGASRVFGPQKGATNEQVNILESALTRLADVVSQQFGFDYRNEPGAGAAGGLGFGLMSFCGAKIRPGFDVVAESIGLKSKLEAVDLVITGEGSLDRQTLEGKTPAGVAGLARKIGKRVYAMVGRASEDREVRELFDRVYELAQKGLSKEQQMSCAAELLRKRARELAKDLNKTRNAQRPTSNAQ
jgi:glycerate 2-kinase